MNLVSCAEYWGEQMLLSVHIIFFALVQVGKEASWPLLSMPTGKQETHR